MLSNQNRNFLSSQKKKKTGTVEVRFREVAIIRLQSATLLRTHMVVLAPVCLGRRASRVRGEHISWEMDVTWLVDVILLDTEEKVVVFLATRTPNRNRQLQRYRYGGASCRGRQKIWLKQLRPEKILKVSVGGKIRWGYKCVPKGHIRADCPPSYVKVKKRHEN